VGQVGQGEGGLQILVGQVEQGEEGLQIFLGQVGQGQRKQRHSLKLGKKRRESSKRNYYIISPKVIIKAIIIKGSVHLNHFTCPKWDYKTVQ